MHETLNMVLVKDHPAYAPMMDVAVWQCKVLRNPADAHDNTKCDILMVVRY